MEGAGGGLLGDHGSVGKLGTASRNRTQPFEVDTKGCRQEENPTMSPRALLVILTTAGVLASVTADAANLSSNPGVRSPGVSNTNALAGRPPGYGYGPHSPPPLPQSSANDPFDTSSNLNPGGGGGGSKPGKKPNLQ
jgi:hypothetical protein